ncbi:MAG TPA: NUDIX hydrolase [Methylophaga aminisulfidivorans]|uniref:NUDIX hydrolase n=2 Tax=root TaxID=1 RepID=A0A7C1VZV1_9GAMM|nr:NUDIX hydrolase [Methylophaga aminisulfidivorans]
MNHTETDKLLEAIHVVESFVDNPKKGLPQSVFYFITRLTPMVNVDLLIKDKNNRTLLAWRDDEFAGAGWHVPGGIVRYKETLEQRIQQVALTEIGQKVQYDSKHIALNEIHRTHSTRGHFISFLYSCSIGDAFVPNNEGLKRTDAGYLAWHERCPDNLIAVHKMYQHFI